MAKVLSTYESPVIVNTAWCKACGICMVLCPRGVLIADSYGKAVAAKVGNCSSCGICEEHCPDYAVRVGEK